MRHQRLRPARRGTTESSPTPVTALPEGSGATLVAASVANKSSYAS
ncbi:hypothetical protein ACFWVF_04100 [Streptomyces sp. NPDC058659]